LASFGICPSAALFDFDFQTPRGYFKASASLGWERKTAEAAANIRSSQLPLESHWSDIDQTKPPAECPISAHTAWKRTFAKPPQAAIPCITLDTLSFMETMY
jgi:hypothetical protein